MAGQKTTEIKKWITLSSEKVANYRVFSVRKLTQRSVTMNKKNDFYILDSPDWVNVIAINQNKEVILIEQYRHGTDEITLEIPGGCVDTSDASTLLAAQRELREETGYIARHWHKIGFFSPNPAIQSNHCHTFLATDVEYEGEQRLDSNEEITIKTVPLSRIPGLVTSGKIHHSIIITAFSFLSYWVEKNPL